MSTPMIPGNPTRTPRPCFIVGTNLSSGDVQTGEVPHFRGGGRCGCIYSGALAPGVGAIPGTALTSGGHTMLFSGAGRLNSVAVHTQMVSGAAITFYDSATIAASGIGGSGQKIIGVIPTTWTGGQQGSGAINTGSPWNGEPVRFEMPFNSGLCVNAPSGAPGFTVSWTPEVSQNFPNP